MTIPESIGLIIAGIFKISGNEIIPLNQLNKNIFEQSQTAYFHALEADTNHFNIARKKGLHEKGN